MGVKHTSPFITWHLPLVNDFVDDAFLTVAGNKFVSLDRLTCKVSPYHAFLAMFETSGNYVGNTGKPATIIYIIREHCLVEINRSPICPFDAFHFMYQCVVIIYSLANL